jgi:ParB-like chromosome segregation protein Spo0J
MTAIETTTMPFAQLRLSDPAFTNPRTTTGLEPAAIAELAIHIARNGLLVPLLVRADGLIFAGQRRYLAIDLLHRWTVKLAADAAFNLPRKLFDALLAGIEHEDDDLDKIADRSIELWVVPVRILFGDNIGDLAIAENLQRSDLSSYEVAAAITALHERGSSGVELARALGKSTAYVSRKLSAFRDACAEVKEEWRTGRITEERVHALVALPPDRQRLELAGDPRAKRGPAMRPSIDVVKDALAEVGARASKPAANPISQSYENGVLDALRWVAGQKTSENFAKLVENE